MDKLDHKKILKHLYRASAKKVVSLDVPAMHFLRVDGANGPESPEWAEAIEALYSVSYTAKFMLKKQSEGINYSVMPLEGLWWADDMSTFTSGDKAQWEWCAMIMQPDCVDQTLIQQAIEQVREKKNLPAMDRLRYESFTEGPCAQIMHIGPFTEEGPTVQKVHDYIESQAKLSGKHHEIYLSDIRRANPKNWKTIIRQPLK